MDELLEVSDRVVVMAHKAETLLKEVYGGPCHKITLIPHGVPDVPFLDPNFYKDQLGAEGRLVVMTFGLIGPGKGIETVIEALRDVVNKFPKVLYIVLGATHPHIRQQ
jgi:glycosyltransferase involved in cell wall biosynthesis